MRTGGRGLVGVLVAMLAMTGAAVAPPIAMAEEPAIDWTPCAGAEGVDCATIEVPLDWSEPDGETIHIGLARRPAKDQANRIGSILMDPGGPGGSGVGTVMRDDVFTEEVSARFDVVGFDPRGINTSTLLRCDDELGRQAMAARHPANQAEFDELARLNRDLRDSCREHSGALVDHVDNLHTVQDMDAIRRALGEEKLSYVGYSYGSLMGQQYAEEFPERIRAFVLDGNMDHSLKTTWDFMRTETAPVERNFVEFADWCDRTPECALYGLDTRAVYADLRERARAGDLTDPATGAPIDFYGFAQTAFTVNSPQAWGRLATGIRALHDGAGTPVLTALLAEPVRNPYPAIWCADWDYPVRDFAEYDRLRQRLARSYPNIQWTPYVDHAMTCVGSGAENTNPRQRLDVDDDAPPIVMIGNVHDPATVYEWNRTAARQSGARLITYEGWGHTIYGGGRPSECVNDAVDAYLIDLRAPKRGLTCPATEEPGVDTAGVTPLGPGRSEFVSAGCRIRVRDGVIITMAPSRRPEKGPGMEYALLIYGDEKFWAARTDDEGRELVARHDTFAKMLVERGAMRSGKE